jgi:hypothetical protein
MSVGLVVIIAAAVLLTPAAAQDGELSEAEQAALDDVRAALENFINVTTYSADISQQTKQDIGMRFQGETVRLEQEVDAQGTIQLEKVTDGELDNQHLSLTEHISQQLSGAGADQDSELGPVLLDLIIVDDRIYMRLKMESDTSGLLPEGWVDVTDGAEAFPGMGLFDIQQMLKISGNIGPEYVTGLLEAVVGIEIQEPSEVEGQTINHYRLDLNPALAFGTIADVESMFNSSELPFDVAGLVDLMYTDEDTALFIDLGVGADDQKLVELTQVITIDITIGPELITDPSLKEAEMTMLQTSNQTYRFYGFDEPVTINAPDLAE